MRTRMITAEYLQDLSGFVELEVVTHFELGLDATNVERCDEIGKLMPTLTHLKFIPSVADQLLPSAVCDDEEEDETSNVGTVYSNIPRIASLGTKLSNLRVLWISRCQVKDLRGLQFSPVLQELYASFNQISCLDPLGALQQTLEVCDLEGNNITNIDSVLHNFGNSRDIVSGAMNNSSLLSKRLNRDSGGQSNSSPLRTLTVSGNPFAFQNADYRIDILRHLPHLQLLDDTDVQPDELSSALCLQSSPSTAATTTSAAAAAQSGPTSGKGSAASAQHFDPQGEASLLYTSLQRNMHDPLKSMMDTQHRDLKSRQTASSAVGGSRAGPRNTPPQKNSVVEPSSTLTQSRAVFRGGLVRSLREAASSQPASTCSTPPAMEQVIKQQSFSNASTPATPKSAEKGFSPSPPRRDGEKASRALDEILAHELSVHDPLANICGGDDDDDDHSETSTSISTTATDSKIVRMVRPQSTLLADGLREMYTKKGVILIFDGEEENTSPIPQTPKEDEDLDKLFDEVENGPSQTPKEVSPTPSQEQNRPPSHLLSSADILVEMQREKAKTAKVVLESALFETTHHQSHSHRPDDVSPRTKVFRNSANNSDEAQATGYETISMDDLGDDGGATFDDVM